MKQNKQTASALPVLIMLLVAFACLVFARRKPHDDSFENPDKGTVLFSEFKDSKKKFMEKYSKDANKPESYESDKAGFCWNDEQGSFEKTDFNLNGATIISPAKFSKTGYGDLNNNSIGGEYSLRDGQLTVFEGSKTVWQSPEGWWVEDFTLADSNDDGSSELNLSVWKSGSFGDFKPFWIEENDPSVKNHFFVFGIEDKGSEFHPVWQSSNLTAPNCRILFDDLDGDNKDELIALEGDYVDTPDCKGQYVSIWKWNGWGFMNEWRSEKGNFDSIAIYKVEGKKCVAGF